MLPEIAALRSSRGLIRIPPELDVPITPRVRRLVDTPQFRRLAGISQLGLVSLVYPAANHTRLEHSLGVYRMALLFLDRLADDPRFSDAVTPRDAERFLVAALLHDIGHWPFCHPIEDVSLAHVPKHEQFARRFLCEPEVADALHEDWEVCSEDVVRLLSGEPRCQADKILQSLLSGPIDVDKMDYLMRDSLHAGVPYGRNFDQARLIQSLCLNAAGDGLAITDKGKTAAEMMVFARYVMFSEVYWHHTVRSATAMLQRAFVMLGDSLDHESLFALTERPMIEEMLAAAGQGPASELLDGLFGPVRRLYKRVAQYSLYQEPQLYDLLARRPYPWLVRCAENFSDVASKAIGQSIAPHEILFDAPPVKLEVQFQIEVYFAKEDCYRPLGDISPVVKTLAQQQFDDYVKRVRVLAHPRISKELSLFGNLAELVREAASRTPDKEN
ncbi:MAG: HD domain-containing protein [Planctomycetes bacterium]|nr:HD domain-containing protein [Planctomycetota bacterium]